MFSREVLGLVARQVASAVVGGAVFQVGVRLGNAVVDQARDAWATLTGSTH